MRAAGAIVVGKTNTPEIGWKGATDNRSFGPTRNPWDETRPPGGSPGGGSAQVAARRKCPGSVRVVCLLRRL